MPITYSIRGTGLTQRRVTTITGTVGTVVTHAEGSVSAEAADPLNWISEIRENCYACLRAHDFRGPFESYAFTCGKWVHVEDETKARAHSPLIELFNLDKVVLSTCDEDSDPGFAVRILAHLRMFDICRKRENLSAYGFLWLASELCTEWRMKTLYDRAVRHGQKMDPNGKNIEEHNRMQKEDASLRSAKILELRNELPGSATSKQRKMSTNKIAHAIQAKLMESGVKLSVRTITRYLKKLQS